MQKPAIAQLNWKRMQTKCGSGRREFVLGPWVGLHGADLVGSEAGAGLGPERLAGGGRLKRNYVSASNGRCRGAGRAIEVGSNFFLFFSSRMAKFRREESSVPLRSAQANAQAGFRHLISGSFHLLDGCCC